MLEKSSDPVFLQIYQDATLGRLCPSRRTISKSIFVASMQADPALGDHWGPEADEIAGASKYHILTHILPEGHSLPHSGGGLSNDGKDETGGQP